MIRWVIVLGLAFLSSACSSQAVPAGSPNVDATVQAAVKATVGAASPAAAVVSPTAAPASSGPMLSLVSASTTRTSGSPYFTVTGTVKNISGQQLDGVRAVAVMNDGRFQSMASSDALLDANPLPAGMSTTFKVLVRVNGEIGGSARVAFADLRGKPIPFKDENGMDGLATQR